jgi:hypothetical protein
VVNPFSVAEIHLTSNPACDIIYIKLTHQIRTIKRRENKIWQTEKSKDSPTQPEGSGDFLYYHSVPLCLRGFVAMSQLCKTNPILLRTETMQSLLLQGFMETNHPAPLGKNKPNQTQFQNRQNEDKHRDSKGLCKSTTNNEQRTLFKTNPIEPNSPVRKSPCFARK